MIITTLSFHIFDKIELVSNLLMNDIAS